MNPEIITNTPTTISNNGSNESNNSMCRRISFMLPKDLPQLQAAARPDFFVASHLVQEFSCSNSSSKDKQLSRVAPRDRA
jgi:hypothetical protein